MTDKGLLSKEDPTALVEDGAAVGDDEEEEDPYDYPPTVPGRSSNSEWIPRMLEALLTKSLYKVLQTCEDFANEPSAIQDAIQKRGHICRYFDCTGTGSNDPIPSTVPSASFSKLLLLDFLQNVTRNWQDTGTTNSSHTVRYILNIV